MAVIAGATYREGLAIVATDGRVYINPLPTGTVVPTTAQQAKGARNQGGMKLDPDGRLYVRYV